ncbi:GDSL-type esterase/lipase family protein [Pontibacter korlensis]|uniref:GDSL-type esterase/lipase family protein n=1 Tax=Pontibacter korlensis TaxID=400092 RepID=UPI00061AB285|nr:GDSL-type esterase/lipase family protein [Pontibacter korlensis]
MRRSIQTLLTLGFILLLAVGAQAQSTIKVACIGNSITEGVGLETTYPEALQELLGDGYEVRNFGASARTLLKKGGYSYWDDHKYQDALSWNPDMVIIKLGTNDTKPQHWQFKEEFIPNYIELVASFKDLPSKPKVYLCYPLPVFEDKWGINEETMKNEILPAVKKVAKKTKVKTIDLYTAFLGKADLTYDAIHPNEAGAALIANEVYKALPVSNNKKKAEAYQSQSSH